MRSLLALSALALIGLLAATEKANAAAAATCNPRTHVCVDQPCSTNDLGVSTMDKDQKNIVVCLKNDAGELKWKSMSGGDSSSSGLQYINPVMIFNSNKVGQWVSVNYPSQIPTDAKKVILHFNVIEASGDGIIKIKAQNLPEMEAAYTNAGSSWGVAGDTNTKTIPYSSDRKIDIYWLTTFCKNGVCWAKVSVIGYEK